MKSKSGYILPDNPSPIDMMCIKVFIPKEDEYLYAFMGAYSFFTTWVAWEKDGTNRASLAATAWKAAYEATIEEQNMECVDMATFEEVVDACCTRIVRSLDGISDSIDASPSGVGGCDCLPIGDNIDDDDEVIWNPDGGNTPPQFDGGSDPVDDYKQAKCNNSNALADVLITVFRGMAGMSVTFLGVVSTAIVISVLLILIPGAVVVTASGMLVIGGALVSLYGTAGFSWQMFDGIADYVEQNRADLVCAMYGTDGTQAAVSAVTSIFQDAIDSVLSVETQQVRDAVEPLIASILTEILSNATLNNIFNTFNDSLFTNWIPPLWSGQCPDCDSFTGGTELSWTFDNNDQEWQGDSDGGWFGTDGNPTAGCLRFSASNINDGSVFLTYAAVLGLSGFVGTPDIRVIRIEFDMKRNNDAPNDDGWYLHPTTGNSQIDFDASSLPDGWSSHTVNLGGILNVSSGVSVIFTTYRQGVLNGHTILVDNIKLFIEEV